jgi:hypothetical protein
MAGGVQGATPENQQERLRYEGWVVGFVDGEGCFSCPLFRSPKMTLGRQVRPEFAVVQGASSRHVLEELVEFFGCGKVYLNRRRDNHREDLLRYCVQRIDDLRSTIVPYFMEHPLRTTKRDNFEKFATVIEMMGEGVHLIPVRSRGDRRDRGDHESSQAITISENPQRPYANHLVRDRGEEMVRTLRRRREAGRNVRPAW